MHGSKEALALSELMREMGFVNKVELYVDSDSARAILSRSGPGALKHVEIRRFAIQQWLKAHRLPVHRVDTKWNLADVGAKVLDQERLRFLAERIGLRFS